jgi:hypothetical protein
VGYGVLRSGELDGRSGRFAEGEPARLAADVTSAAGLTRSGARVWRYPRAAPRPSRAARNSFRTPSRPTPHGEPTAALREYGLPVLSGSLERLENLLADALGVVNKDVVTAFQHDLRGGRRELLPVRLFSLA